MKNYRNPYEAPSLTQEQIEAIRFTPGFIALVAGEDGWYVKYKDSNNNEFIKKLTDTIQSGEGINSLYQNLDSSWGSVNPQVGIFIETEKINTEGLQIKIDDSGKNIVPGAFNKYASAWGGKSQAIGSRSHAEGGKTIAFESAAHSEGTETFAGGKHSHAEGCTTAAIGSASHSEGYGTLAKGENSHAEGNNTQATGYASHSEGNITKAEGIYSHAEGVNTRAYGQGAHAEGEQTEATNWAHAEGYMTKAKGEYSHSEGHSAKALKFVSHAEGCNTKADGEYSHAEGYYTETTENYAHAQGYYSKAKGIASNATGWETEARAPHSTTMGKGTVCSSAMGLARGRYNNPGDYADIVGNGSEGAPSNAYTLDWYGNAWFKRSVRVGEDNDKLVTDKEVNEKIAALVDSAPETLNTLNELATALDDDPNFATTVTNELAKKANKATTLEDYGITDAYTKEQSNEKFQDKISANNSFSNTLKGSAIGQSVNLTDVSPIEHTLDVKVKSKNISVVTRYANATGTNNLLVNSETIPMEVGKVYTASWDTEVSDVRCWFTLYQSYREFISQSENINACDGTRKYYTFKIIKKPGGLGGWAIQQSNSAIAEECPISNFMIEEGEVATEYTPYMADVSGVSVKKCGKNLIPYPYHEKSKTQNGLTFTDNGDGSITVNGTATASTSFKFSTETKPIMLQKGKTYTISGTPNVSGAKLTLQDIQYRQSIVGTGVVSYDCGYYVFATISSGTVCNNLVFKPQLEIGATATEYELYNPTTYTVNADGTVEGVTPSYPSMTLTASNTGAVVDVTYNRDINKAFAESQNRIAELEQKLTNAVISLGGNV